MSDMEENDRDYGGLAENDEGENREPDSSEEEEDDSEAERQIRDGMYIYL